MKTKYLYYYLHWNKSHPPLDNLPTLDSLKKTYILYLLRITANDLKETAEILQISQQRLRKSLSQYNLTSAPEDESKYLSSGDRLLG